MNDTDALWDAATASAIGADWLHVALAPAGDFGRRARARERLLRRGDEARARSALAQVDALARRVDRARLTALRVVLAGTPDPTAIIGRAAAGSTLDDVDLFELSRFFDGLDEIAKLAADDAFGNDRPAALDAALGPELRRGRTVNRSFYLNDAYAPELVRARLERDAAQAEFDAQRSRLAAQVADYAGVEHVRNGEFMLMRERIAGPLPAQIRVLREAPTYVLCELALDAAALAAEARRDDAATHVAEAEESVRACLSQLVAGAAPAIERACKTLGVLDLLVVRVLFAQQHCCTVPEIVDVPEIVFADARYLPLAVLLAERGRTYVPLDLRLDGVGIITGPNMGGKTAALRTVGFFIACAAYGVPVPARSARVPLVDEMTWLGIASDIGRGTSRHDAGEPKIAANDSGGTRTMDDARSSGPALLSAFAGEIVAAQAYLQRSPRLGVVLIDEFAGTTSPREGRALLVALLATLRARGSLALASTHFDRVAAAAGARHYATGILRPLTRNEAPLPLDGTLERIARAMDYRIHDVAGDVPTDTGALALADALGLDPGLLNRARDAL